MTAAQRVWYDEDGKYKKIFRIIWSVCKMKKMKIEDQYRVLCYKLGIENTRKHNRAQDKIKNMEEQT